MPLRRLTQQMIRQQRNILRALMQRRNFQADHIQAVEEIFTELLSLHRFRQIAMGGGKDAHVDIKVAVAAQRTHLTLLQHAQQLNLQRLRHIADFIEKQRTALRRLKQPFARADRAGKRAFGVSEQFRFQQLLRQRAAVDSDKRLAGARTGGMDRFRQHLFSCAALSIDQHADVRLRHHVRLLQQTLHQRAAGDDRLPPGVIAGWRAVRQRLIDGFI